MIIIAGRNCLSFMKTLRYVLCCALSCGMAVASPSWAGLTLISSFSTPGTFNGPDGVAYHPSSGTLFVVDSSNAAVYELTTAGVQVGSFSTTASGVFPEGIDVLPSGNLVVSDESLDLLAEYTTNGNSVGTIDISASSKANSGVVFRESSSTYTVTDDNATSIFEFDTTGNLLSTIDTRALGFSEPEGIEFDPVSGHLLLVDDDTAMFIELTASGTVIGMIDLSELTGFSDPEGLAYDEASRTLYVAFDSDGQIASFAFSPVPEPASLSLFALVGTFFALRRWRRRRDLCTKEHRAMSRRNIINFVANATFASFAFLPTVEAASVLYETATLLPSAPSAGYDLRDNQMAGARFTVSQATEITAIGGQLFANGTLFGAIVTLGVDDLPMPNPGGPSALSGILAMTIFSTSSGNHTDFRAPLSLILAPGTYGLVFGGISSGLSGRMALTGDPLPGAEIFTNSGASWRDLNRDPFNRMRFVIEGHAVPEPSTAVVALTVGGAFVVRWHHSLHSR